MTGCTQDVPVQTIPQTQGTVHARLTVPIDVPVLNHENVSGQTKVGR